MRVTQYIPKEKVRQFHEILVTTGGRYLMNPVEWMNEIEVHYEPGDYSLQCVLWERCNTPIREIRKDHWWLTLLRRLGFRA